VAFGVPHAFEVRGTGVSVQWGGDELFEPKEELGIWIPGDNRIVLHPQLLKDRVQAWRIFMHELLHAYSDLGGHRPLSHKQIDRLEDIGEILASFPNHRRRRS
jgi:hypothetical protein